MFSQHYQIIETLHENVSTVVYRARRLNTGEKVIVKMLKSSEMSEHRINQFINEQQILSLFKFSKIVKLKEVITTPSEYLHIFEDIGGDSLYNILLEKSFSLNEGLNIAIAIAQTLEKIHQKHIIHADVNPKNIIYNPKTKALQMIDFGYSIIDNRFRYNSDSDIGTSGNLMYMSPEQTGKTKQRIDVRSDLYSFGMTLYHLFCAKAPFEAKDRFELIHKQIALHPEPIQNYQSNFPNVLWEIINRLIAKNPEERYQSDAALIHDLKYALRTLDKSGNIPAFEIGLHDRPTLHFGERLFGREPQMAVLRDAAQKVRDHQGTFMAVSGLGGVGKTRFIEEFLHLIGTAHARILRGKFEQNRSSHPYLIFKQLFSQLKIVLMRQSLSQPPIRLNDRSIQILSHYFPDLKGILTKKPPPYLSSDDELRHQLPYALQEFFKHFATDESPLVIFMDDLQWADAASLDLIQKGVLQSTIPNLHFITSYRSNELGNNAAALRIIEDIAQNPSENVYRFDLMPINQKDTANMIRTLFKDESSETDRFASLIHKKTEGNPFYIKTFLENLIDKGEIRFEAGKWVFDLERIALYGSSVNIASLINAKFNQLTHDEQHILYYLSLLGSRFDIRLAQRLIQKHQYSVSLIDSLESKGFLDHYNHHYHFVHDLIQSYITAHIPESLATLIHQHIGEFLERLYNNKEYDDLINVVLHLNQANRDRGWNKRRLKLNIAALQKMLQSGSYPLAHQQLIWMGEHGAMEALESLSGSERFEFGVLQTKTLYLNAQHEDAEKNLNRLIRNSRSIAETMVCFTLYKNLCVTRGEGFLDLVTFGYSLLNRLGMETPQDKRSVIERANELKKVISDHPHTQSVETIMGLKTLTNASQQRIVSILVDFWEAAYYLADISLMQWAYLNIIDISYRYGNSGSSAFGYVLYGAQMVSEERFKEAYRFGEAALKLNHRFDESTMLPKIHNFMANFINPYTKPLSTNVPLYQNSLHQSKINGDIIFGTWANFLMHFSDYLSGVSLEALEENIGKESDFILHSGDQKMIAIFKILQEMIQKWGENRDTEVIEEKYVDLLWQWEEEKFYPGLAWFGIMQAQLCWIEGKNHIGLEYLRRYVYTDANEVIMFPKMKLHLFRALLALGIDSDLSEEDLSLLEHDIRMCEAYAAASPREFKVWKLLIDAKKSRNAKTYWDVAKLYDKALKEAKKINNPFAIAACGVSIGRFWKTKNFEDLSRFYFNEAVIGLNRWGAYGAAERIREAECLKKPLQLDEELGNSSNSSLLRAEPTNYRSLLKSFFALSESMERKELLQVLMQTILENATASSAILILKEEECFYASARSDFKNGTIELFRSKLQECDFIPLHLITHAIETKRKVIQNSPSESGKFQYDDYFSDHKPASSIAIPSIIEGEVRGVLYLENSEIPTPLNRETIQTLRLLLTQAMIVYKNTLLYETLKTNERNLNKAQRISHVGSWQYDFTDDAIHWSAETYRIYEVNSEFDLINFEWYLERIHPEDRETFLIAVEKALNGNQILDVTHRIQTMNGVIRIVHQLGEVYWENEHKKLAGTVQDITETKRAEEMIDRLSAVVNQTPLSTIITDPNGVIEYANAYASKLNGYFNHELIGQKMNLFNSGIHSKSFYENLWSTITDKRSFWRGTIINKMKNGALRDCASTIFPIINDHNQITHFVTIQDDITERNMKDRAFLMQTRQAQMGEMLSMIAHQWRQPLSIMSALMSRQKINIMLDRFSIDDITKSFDEMETQIQHLSRTITDFKDFFKPDKQALKTKSSTIVSKTLELIEHTLMNKNIGVITDYRNDYEYDTYENELIQVMLNLIKNAQDAFDERKIENGVIHIDTDQIDAHIIIHVEDNAGGISPEIINTLFSPYTSTKKENGTGLGLYMSKTIIEEHCHGTIHAENTADGVRFVIRFPIQYEREV